MNSFGTQAVDSLKKTNISFDFLSAARESSGKKEPIFYAPSPVCKKKRETSTRPIKKIRFSAKTDYNFLDTQAQLLTPFSVNNTNYNGNLGELSSTFARFLSEKGTKKVNCKVLNLRIIYGCKVATVEVQNGSSQIYGKMNMVCNGPVTKGAFITLIDPKVMNLNNLCYIFPKEIC